MRSEIRINFQLLSSSKRKGLQCSKGIFVFNNRPFIQFRFLPITSSPQSPVIVYSSEISFHSPHLKMTLSFIYCSSLFFCIFSSLSHANVNKWNLNIRYPRTKLKTDLESLPMAVVCCAMQSRWQWKRQTLSVENLNFNSGIDTSTSASQNENQFEKSNDEKIKFFEFSFFLQITTNNQFLLTISRNCRPCLISS